MTATAPRSPSRGSVPAAAPAAVGSILQNGPRR